MKALERLTEYNREKLGLKQLLTKISPANKAALDLFEKAGYNRIALLPKWHKIGTQFSDFWLLNKEF